MSYSKFMSEIFRESWALYNARVYQENILNLLNGESFNPEAIEREPLMRTVASINSDKAISPFSHESYDDAHPGSVAIISINSVLTKFGNFCMYGAEDYAQMIMEATEHPNIAAIIQQGHSPGGTTSSVIPIKNAIIEAKKQKPVIGFVDSMSASADYYNKSFCDKIIAVDKMAQIGSIGVMATLMKKDPEKLKEQGDIIIEVYPEESSFKNKAVNDALDGDDKAFIKEELRPWAINFQDTVKENRAGKLDMSVEGLLGGKMFYGYDAKKYGLIDEIGNFQYAVEEALKMARNYNLQKAINY